MPEKRIIISKETYETHTKMGQITVIQTVPDISDDERKRRETAAAQEILMGIYHIRQLNKT